MKFAKISQVAHYAPEQVVTNDDLAQIMDTSDEWISSRTGIKKRHISHHESTSDLATRVALDLLKKSGISAQDLDFCYCCYYYARFIDAINSCSCSG